MTNGLKSFHRGMLALGADDVAGLRRSLQAALAAVRAGNDARESPTVDGARWASRERLVIDYGDRDELLEQGSRALEVLAGDAASGWRRLAGRGICRGYGHSHNAPGKVAFLFTGQGAQHVNMLRELVELDPVVAGAFAEADEVMAPLLGRPLSSFMFVDAQDEADLDAAEAALRDTRVTQPAVLTVDVALARLLAQYGIVPDVAIGHSLGEYAALVAAGVFTFAEALHVVSVRGREMSRVARADNGRMAAVWAPLGEVERILAQVEGYVVVCNHNSRSQIVVGGESPAVERAVAAFTEAGYRTQFLAVSHAFHTRIVAPASDPLRRAIAQQSVRAARLPVVSNASGEVYPDDREGIVDLIGRQVDSPVQFVKGVETLYRLGARIFVELGPRRVLSAFVEEILGDHDDVVVVCANHPRRSVNGVTSFNQALCALYAAGLGGA
ncbi:MAG: acyltransferase domain-containing protein [Anaerolineae bacterium]|nr:acyltransferase domain-containing protein [Anaerolineae bacterium]